MTVEDYYQRLAKCVGWVKFANLTQNLIVDHFRLEGTKMDGHLEFRMLGRWLPPKHNVNLIG